MPRALILLGAVLGAGFAAAWALGGLDGFTAWAAASQREAQNALARAIRALRAGEAGALLALLTVCFAYGFFHAAGPGHGKVLIGGYGVARRVRMLPLMAVAVASSLAQATTAVILVYAGVFVLGLTREGMVGLTEDIFAPISYGAIGLIGLWLAWRGLRAFLRAGLVEHHHHGHGHGHHDHSDDCGCGHAHGPDPAQVAALTGWRDTALLIGGIAIRPCTGALFLLILCWRMGIDAAGIAGAYAMGLGTATITVAVAFMAVWAREGALHALAGGRLARAAPLIELGAGLTVAVLSAIMLRAAL
ncbi:nickel/cobalt transporter [Pseudorhodobacter ferrugineus]|uniref:nickel/cobalt transporter n=1 Tax=Pseudorhodobacter ferrugineus TaxID=77008 RepID=UPI0003B33280|nr:membrane protein [Pseudorhodobacter ferrugineus]